MKVNMFTGGIVVMGLIFVGAGCSSTPTTTEETVVETVVIESPLTAGAYTFDTDMTTLAWLGDKKLGHSHQGVVNVSSGEVLIDENGVISGGTIVIDMTSISGEDEPTMLINHLKNEDFFDTETFPNATLELTGSTALEDGSFEVTGDLTIKDITESVTIPATLTTEGSIATASATFEIDRTLWNIQYGSGKFFSDLGDNVIEDNMQFTLNVTANNFNAIEEPTEEVVEEESIEETDVELQN